MAEKEIDRKIAVIFATDVVGYSQLMKNNEIETLKSFRSCKKILEGLFKEHGGKIFNTAGDSVLAEFTSAVSAVVCAAEFQKLVKKRNESDETSIKMKFRVGISMGDVVKEGKNLYGEGVNIAARLESHAQPDGICISKSVHDFVNTKTSFLFYDLGEQKIKNDSIYAYDLLIEGGQKRNIKYKSYKNTLKFAVPVIAIFVGIFSYFFVKNDDIDEATPLQELTETADEIIGKTLLIKPIEIRTDSKDVEDLSKSITDHLISSISSTVLINIIPSQKSYMIQERSYSHERIKSEQIANFVLVGSLATSGNKFRTNFELLDLDKDQIVWSLNKDFNSDSLFEAQDELEFLIRKAIQYNATIGKGASDYLSNYFSENKSDYIKLMKLNVAQYKEGVSIGKNHAEPYREIMVSNPENSAAHYFYASNLMRQLSVNRNNISNDIKNVRNSLKKGIELDPTNALLYPISALLKLSGTGMVDKRLINKGLQYGDDNSFVLNSIATVYRFGNNPAKAIEFYKKCFALAPGVVGDAKLNLLRAYIDLRNYKEAKELANQMTRTDKFSKFWGKLILIFISYTKEDKDKGIDLYKKFINENSFSGQDLENEVLSYPWVTYDDWYKMNLVRVLKKIEKDLNE